MAHPTAYSARVPVRGWWDPYWYNLDQALRVGRRDKFAFARAAPPSDYDVLLANGVGGPGHDWDYWWATVESIEHDRFGAVVEVDTRSFGEYAFVFGDGRWVRIEAEECLGLVNAAGPDFPVDDCGPGWAGSSGWALAVVFSDVVRTPGTA